MERGVWCVMQRSAGVSEAAPAVDESVRGIEWKQELCCCFYMHLGRPRQGAVVYRNGKCRLIKGVERIAERRPIGPSAVRDRSYRAPTALIVRLYSIVDVWAKGDGGLICCCMHGIEASCSFCAGEMQRTRGAHLVVSFVAVLSAPVEVPART